jgi:hypothetical protein
MIELQDKEELATEQTKRMMNNECHPSMAWHLPERKTR